MHRELSSDVCAHAMKVGYHGSGRGRFSDCSFQVEIKNLSSRTVKETPHNFQENQYCDRKIILRKEVEEGEEKNKLKKREWEEKEGGRGEKDVKVVSAGIASSHNDIKITTKL